MKQEWWEKYECADEIYSLRATDKQMVDVAEYIKSGGYVPVVEEDWFRGGLGLLAQHFNQEPPTREELRERILAFAHRERPHMPLAYLHDSNRHVKVIAESWCEWVDPQRVFLKEPGEKSFIHHTVDEMADYAFRLANTIRTYPESLRDILSDEFGYPASERGNLIIKSWDTPLGALYCVETNGNHRLTVFAALRVPCVMAEVYPKTATYNTRAATENDVKTILYRRLLHTYGIASIPDLGMFNFINITTQWPILLDSPEDAVRSLAAMEKIAGRPWTGNIGDLPRAWFNDAEFLTTASRGLFEKLTTYRDNRPPLDPAQQTWLQKRKIKWEKQRSIKQPNTNLGELPPPPTE